MKIVIANESAQGIGGGWSFIGNLYKGLEGKAELLSFNDWDKGDVILIPSASMVSRDFLDRAREKNKKIVLRVDNALRNTRNRSTGMTRMKEFAQVADLVIYQSQWAKDYLYSYLKKDGPVIYNGIDLDIFKIKGSYKDFKGEPTYLYSRYSRDESKEWIRAWYQYQEIQKVNPKAKLIICGRFSDDLRSSNFDFFNGEKYEYIGIIEDKREMAQVYRGCQFLLAPYYCDCYSNTYQEAMACGVHLYDPDMSGGTPELIKNGPIDCKDMAKKYLEVFNELL